ncbi:hypothetical protein [Escherichia coli]|uniref:hypothetical protein n=1 Tax=Escherichia coli TaxID=562 RepID=UPI00131A51B1|nr:hypothetical protein [Escherichia coli]
MINDKSHIRYDFMCFALLSYYLLVFRRADPVSGGSGSADPSLPSAGQISQDVVLIPADITLYAVFIPVFASQSSAAKKITSLIH